MDPTEPIVDPGRLGHYLLLAPLGEGGVGQVHAAVRAGTQQLVVLKQLRVELSESVAAQERLRREAEILGLLDHPGIARLFDAGYADDRLFLVLEHITGTTLAKLAAAHLEDGRLVPYAVSCTLACDFLEALAHAHRLAGPDGAPLGLVHRDLSPRNLLMDRSGRGRLIDFGVARAVMGRMETVPGAVVGTPRYLAPEQARGEQVGQRADLYTLGVVLYELLTAQRVTPRADRAAVMQAVLHHTPPPLHTVNPRLPRGLSDVLSTALDKDPGARFEDAEQFLAALLDAAGELARAPRDRLHLYFDECFPEVRSAVEGLEARARQEGPRAAVPGVTFALFARAQAEAWVPTRTGGPGPAEPSHPPSRAGGPLRAPLATGGPGPAESGSAEPEAWHEPTRTDVTHAPEHATQITPPRSRPGQVEGLEVPAHARPTVPMAFFPGDPAAPGPVETREVPAHARPTVPMASFTADPLTLVARAEPPERGAGPRVSPRSPPPDPALVPRRRRRRSLRGPLLGLAGAAALVGAYALGRVQAPGLPSTPRVEAALPTPAMGSPGQAPSTPGQGAAREGVASARAVGLAPEPSPMAGPPPAAPAAAAHPSASSPSAAPVSETPSSPGSPSATPAQSSAGSPSATSAPGADSPSAPAASSPPTRGAITASPTAAPRGTAGRRAPPPPELRPGSAPVPEPAVSAETVARLRRAAAQLSSAPSDRAAFLELMGRIEAESRGLPRPAAVRIAAHLSAAERSFDPRELAAAVEALAGAAGQ